VDAKSLETHSGRVFVPFPSPLQPVRLIQRRNRFVVDVRRDAGAARHVQTAALPDIFPLHLPNSGRMTELLQPGTLGLAHVEQRRGRGTAGTLLLVQYQGRWVSVDARMPNRLFARCLELKALPPFLGYTEWKAEVSWGQGRVDFLLSPSEEKLPEKRSRELPPCLVETKSCNLVVDSLALFPDAPTARGARHLRELAEAVELGYRAAVVWFVQRDDARALSPHGKADPVFAEAFREARARGVEAYAYRCFVEPRGITVLDEIPVVTP
jgi:sugar fermentation stimulation protein